MNRSLQLIVIFAFCLCISVQQNSSINVSNSTSSNTSNTSNTSNASNNSVINVTNLTTENYVYIRLKEVCLTIHNLTNVTEFDQFTVVLTNSSVNTTFENANKTIIASKYLTVRTESMDSNNNQIKPYNRKQSYNDSYDDAADIIVVQQDKTVSKKISLQLWLVNSQNRTQAYKLQTLNDEMIYNSSVNYGQGASKGFMQFSSFNTSKVGNASVERRVDSMFNFVISQNFADVSGVNFMAYNLSMNGTVKYQNTVYAPQNKSKNYLYAVFQQKKTTNAPCALITTTNNEEIYSCVRSPLEKNGTQVVQTFYKYSLDRTNNTLTLTKSKIMDVTVRSLYKIKTDTINGVRLNNVFIIMFILISYLFI